MVNWIAVYRSIPKFINKIGYWIEENFLGKRNKMNLEEYRKYGKPSDSFIFILFSNVKLTLNWLKKMFSVHCRETEIYTYNINLNTIITICKLC